MSGIDILVFWDGWAMVGALATVLGLIGGGIGVIFKSRRNRH